MAIMAVSACVVAPGSRGGAAAALGFAALCAATQAHPTPAAAADTAWAPKISAVYKINVAGFDLGTFNFSSTVKDGAYALSGHSKLSWGFGMFHWSSQTNASGSVAGSEVKPAGYTFDYKSNAKAGSVKIGFGGDGVSSVSIVPPSPPAPGTVPLTEKHLKGVFDPMSALTALSRGSAANPCGKRIAIFDGKQRFDIVLSFRRQEKVEETKPSGQPAVAYVCRVQYIPVAGYKNNKDTQSWASNAGIEVALRPIPAANMLVPYRITIPTPVGTATLAAQRVDITAPGNKAIALTH